ncbi:chromosome segregation ATPase [Streptomyces sp. NPDC004592]
MAEEPPARRSSNLSEAAATARTQLSPKYVQLRGDQQIELDVVARELQAARAHKGERITANTVIRVAVDFVLAHRERLVGSTEDEIRTNFLAYVRELEERAHQNGT